MLSVAAFVLVARQPKFNPAEIQVQESLRNLGAHLAWVIPDERESADKWVLSLDVENKAQTFDCSRIKTLKRLYALRILGGRVKESSLDTLAALPNLGLLVITGAGISDAGLKSIARCKSVNKLDIAGPSISSSSLKEVAKMTSLRRLFLYNTKLKDADLKALEMMTFLDQLDLPLTVSAEAAKSLATKLPKTHIDRI